MHDFLKKIKRTKKYEQRETKNLMTKIQIIEVDN